MHGDQHLPLTNTIPPNQTVTIHPIDKLEVSMVHWYIGTLVHWYFETAQVSILGLISLYG